MRYLLFLLVFALSCSPKPTKYPKIEIQPEEYEVYNAFFNSIFDAIPKSEEFKHYQIFIVDSIGWGMDTLMLERIISNHEELNKNNPTLSKIETDWFVKQAYKVHLEDKFTIKSHNSYIVFIIIKPSYQSYLLKTMVKKSDLAPLYKTCFVFFDVYPDAPGIFELSRVGFNNEKTEAFLEGSIIRLPTPIGGKLKFKKIDGLWTTSDSSSNAMIHHISKLVSGKIMKSKS